MMLALKTWIASFVVAELMMLAVYLSICFVKWQIVSVDGEFMRLQFVVLLFATGLLAVLSFHVIDRKDGE